MEKVLFRNGMSKVEKARKGALFDLNLQLSDIHDKHSRKLARLHKEDVRLRRAALKLREGGQLEKALRMDEQSTALAGEIILLENALSVVERAAKSLTSEQFKREYIKGLLCEDVREALETYLRRGF